MNPKHPPVTRAKTLHIAQCLCGRQRAKGIRLVGDVQIRFLIRRDLQEHPGIGTALMELAG